MWDAEQAEAYVTRLDASFAFVAAKPERGRLWRKGVRRYRVAQHIVYYRVYAEHILIVRVLHKRQLPQNYL